MIKFINAKINIGLQIVRKREDGYHDLQTVFYPVGIYAGTPENPTEFCDILEIVPSEKMRGDKILQEDKKKCRDGMPRICFRGRDIGCPPEKNLVTKAVGMFMEEKGIDTAEIEITLEKHLPDGAGMGGGSADATFTLIALSDYFNTGRDDLHEMARKLGADCPFFLENRAVYAEGIGDKMEAINLDLKGYWIVAVKPDIYISTAEAFRGVTPKEAEYDLREIVKLPLEEWKDKIKNDFETSILPRFPIIGEVKEKLYRAGASYASMTGSGSVVYGIFKDEKEGSVALHEFRNDPTIGASYLLKL